MKAVEGRNNVKVYNLSAGKSLPEWLTESKRRKLTKRDVEIRRKIELIQDFTMPDVSGCIRMSPDGRYILATGTYSPRVRCYETAALSLKFERCIDYEVLSFDVLSEDYSKLVFLQEDRYVEFHNQGGFWFRMRIPKFGRDTAYHYPSCDLYLAASGSEIYRLNLHQGRFLNPLQTDSPGVNRCEFNKQHYLFCCGTEDGRVEAWDPRSRHRVGVLDCAVHMITEDLPLNTYKYANQLGITAMAFNDGLTLGVGTLTGQVLIYDIRSDKPLLVKDHNDGLPIRSLHFHQTGKVVSMSSKIVKIWDKDTGDPHTSIEPGVDFNDLCLVPDSGMMFMATEDVKMQTYFLPSLGTAPRWCSHLDALIEELEEEDVPAQYDDYKFVTEEELKQIGLHDLIGTQMLRAVMHGYYIDTRLYNKARQVANPFDYDEFLRRKVKQKISEQNKREIKTKRTPKVNKDLYEKLLEAKEKKLTKVDGEAILADDRFSDLFTDRSFQIDKDSQQFMTMNPALSKLNKVKRKQHDEDRQEEEEFLKAKKELLGEVSSDSDSAASDDEAPKKPNKNAEKDRYTHDSTQEREKYLEKKQKLQQKAQQKKKNIEVVEDTKPSKNLTFTAADTLADVKSSKKKVSKMSLEERLSMEAEQQESVKQLSFGSREMTFSLKKGRRFESLRQQQRQHHEERRKLKRSTGMIKGKIRMNRPS